MCVTFVTCEVRVCGLRCRSGSSLYIYRVYLLTTYYLLSGLTPETRTREADDTTQKRSEDHYNFFQLLLYMKNGIANFTARFHTHHGT